MRFPALSFTQGRRGDIIKNEYQREKAGFHRLFVRTECGNLKKRLRAVMLALCVAVLLCILGFRFHWDRNTLMESRLADENQLAILKNGQYVPPQEAALQLNGAALPYDSTRGCFALPQVPGQPLRGALSANWGQVYLPRDIWNTDLSKAMKESTRLPVYISDGSRWTVREVYLTGLPALNIRTVESTPIYRDPAVYGESVNHIGLAANDSLYTLFWPEGNTRQRVTQGRLEWHWRGNASLFADKKNYRLNLLSQQGQEKGEDLLGLGKESNWILLAMSTDSTRSRDALCWQLWDEMVEANPGANMGHMPGEYVELYLDDQYKGVYRMYRPMNGVSLQLNRADRFYKWRKLYMVTDEELQKAEEKQAQELGNTIDLVWPKQSDAGLWSPLKTYVNQYYRPKETPKLETLKANTNLNNLVDVALFKQFICGADNLFHNQCIIWKDNEKKFYRVPWDLDYTFGNLYNDMYYLDETYTDHLDFTQLVLPDMELDTLWKADPEGTTQKVAKRWKELRSTIFTVENVAQKMDALIGQLQQTGAWQRDWEIWGKDRTYPEPVAHFRTLDRDETIEELEQRLLFLDEYMADYRPPSRELCDVLPQ